MAIRVDVALLGPVGVAPAGQHLVQVLEIPPHVIGVGELHEPLAGQLLLGVAEHLAQRRIGVDDGAFQVLERHADGGVHERVAEARLALAQLDQRALARGAFAVDLTRENPCERAQRAGHQENRQQQVHLRSVQPELAPATTEQADRWWNRKRGGQQPAGERSARARGAEQAHRSARRSGEKQGEAEQRDSQRGGGRHTRGRAEAGERRGPQQLPDQGDRADRADHHRERVARPDPADVRVEEERAEAKEHQGHGGVRRHPARIRDARRVVDERLVEPEMQAEHVLAEVRRPDQRNQQGRCRRHALGPSP